MLGFLEAGGSFKAGDYCQSDLVSMEAASRAACSCQPEACWNLNPRWAPRQLSRRRGDLGALLESFPAYYLLQEFHLDGKVSELLSPNLHFPPNLHGNAAFNIPLGNLFFEVPAKYWGTPVVYVAFLTVPGGLIDENRRNI